MTSKQNAGIGIIGAGTLGRQIASVMGVRGEDIRIFDVDSSASHQAARIAQIAAQERVHSIDDGSVGTITAVNDLAEAVSDAWLVIECVPEKVELKARIFAELSRLSSPSTILASNSSSIPTSRLIENVLRPERVANVHFYNGGIAVEVMSCGNTDPAVLSHLMTSLKKYGLKPFEVRRESVGFIYNRIWAAVKREALSIVHEGVALPEEVDAIYNCIEGQEGPFRRMDWVGLDVVRDIERNYAVEHQGLPDGPQELLDTYVEKGWLGQKTARGFYNDYVE